MCGNSYSKWHSNRLDCNQTALLRCQEHRCCLSKIFKTESKTLKNPQWGAQGKCSVAFLTQGNFSLLFTAFSGAGGRKPCVNQPSDSSGRTRWEAKAGQPEQGSGDTRCPLCAGHGTGGRAAPRVWGSSSQWIPPLGVTGGLGLHVRKGGESLKTTQQVLKEGRLLESDLLASVQAFCSRWSATVGVEAQEGPGGRGAAQVTRDAGSGGRLDTPHCRLELQTHQKPSKESGGFGFFLFLIFFYMRRNFAVLFSWGFWWYGCY